MKLSDIKGEKSFDVIADCIEPIMNIAEDEEASQLFKREEPPEGETSESYVLKKVKASMPLLLKNHKNDIVDILATIEGITRAEYFESLNLGKLIMDFMSLISDDIFLSFFT